MKTFTLHLPSGARPGDPDDLEEAELVKDGFVWGAFVFNAFWFFWHRLWLAGLGVLAATLALELLLVGLRVGPGASLLAWILLSALIGLEANTLRRWTYGRRGRPAVALVTASDRTEAEARGFAYWLDRASDTDAARPALTPALASRYREPDPVIGFFPDAERRR